MAPSSAWTRQNFVIALVVLMVITGLSGVFLSSTTRDIPALMSTSEQSSQVIPPPAPMESKHNLPSRPFPEPNLSTAHSSAKERGDWFDPNKWPKDGYCPFYENICVHNQHLRVHDQADEFTMDTKGGRAQRVFGDHMPNIADSLPIFAHVLNATQWNSEEHEYEHAHCRFVDGPINHMVIQGFFQSMLGEWYTRVLAELYRFYRLTNGTFTVDDDLKMYLFIGDQVPLYTSHHLFMQPFSRYNVAAFTDLIERIECHCYRRLIFCGFQRTSTLNALNETRTVLVPLERTTVATRSHFAAHGVATSLMPLFPSMIQCFGPKLRPEIAEMGF